MSGAVDEPDRLGKDERVMRAAALILMGIALSAPATATAEPTADAAKSKKAKIRELKRDIREMRQSRNRWRARARDAEASIDGGISDQIINVALRGQISTLHALVLEPIRVNWPCGSTLFQGEFSWSLDVALEKTEFRDGEIIETNCSG